MYVDFKEDTTMRSGFSNGLLWMLSGIMMGLLVGLAMYYFANRGIPTANAQGEQKTAESTKAQGSNFAKDQVVETPFGEANKKADPAEEMVASLVDKNHKEEVKERPSFSYYAVLPDLNVPVQTIHNPVKKKEKEKPAKKVAEKKTVAANAAGDYVLQVASYKQRNQADRTKGRLSRKGVTSYVQKRNVKGTTWFRVMAGPVQSKKLDSWKATVASLGHKPLIFPIK